MSEINREIKTFGEWKEILMPAEIEALNDYGITEETDKLSPSEVLEIIVEWNGGIATAYQIKSIISRVYGYEL